MCDLILGENEITLAKEGKRLAKSGVTITGFNLYYPYPRVAIALAEAQRGVELGVVCFY